MNRPKRTYVTKRAVAGGAKTYRPWKEWEPGDELVGKYTGTQEDNFGHTNMVVDVVDAHFEDADLATSIIGKTIVLNSSGVIKKAMESLEIGAGIRVVYNGTGIIAKGNFAGKEAHSMEVSEVDLDSPEEVEDDTDNL